MTWEPPCSGRALGIPLVLETLLCNLLRHLYLAWAKVGVECLFQMLLKLATQDLGCGVNESGWIVTGKLRGLV